MKWPERSASDGFTLIELLVVVLIIGLLSAIAIPIFLGQQNEAKDAAAISDLSLARIALISYSTGNEGAYTTSLTDLVDGGYATSELVIDTAITITLAGADFCIQATSDTGNIFFVTKDTPPVLGDCS